MEKSVNFTLSWESTRCKGNPRPNQMRTRLPWHASVDSDPNRTKLNWTASGCLVRCLSLSQWLLVDQSEAKPRHTFCCFVYIQCGRKNLSVHLHQWQTSVFIVELNLIISSNWHGSPWGMRRSALMCDRLLKNIFVPEATRGQTECERGYLIRSRVASASSGFPAEKFRYYVALGTSQNVRCCLSYFMAW